MKTPPILLGAVAYDPEGRHDLGWDPRPLRGAGVPMDYALFSNYERQVEALLSGQIDVAWNTPLAHVRVRRRTEGRSRSLGMRDSDRDFRAKVVARRDANIRTLADLEGRPSPSARRDSTQARILPLHFAAEGRGRPPARRGPASSTPIPASTATPARASSTCSRRCARGAPTRGPSEIWCGRGERGGARQSQSNRGRLHDPTFRPLHVPTAAPISPTPRRKRSNAPSSRWIGRIPTIGGCSSSRGCGSGCPPARRATRRCARRSRRSASSVGDPAAALALDAGELPLGVDCWH